MMKMPSKRPSRVVIEPVSPVVDGGRHPAKAALGEPVTVVADVFGDGHDAVAAAIRWRFAPLSGDTGDWNEVPLVFEVNDRWSTSFTPEVLGRHEYEIIGWSDHCETWRRGTAAKVAADVDVSVEILGGLRLLAPVATAARKAGASDDAEALARLIAELEAGDASSLTEPGWAPIFSRHADRSPVARSGRFPIDVDRERARFSAWYEFFPRSAVLPNTAPAGLRDAIGRLDYIADLGFDVVYLPPITPIGVTNRKGANNSTEAAPDDVGSPWGIGGPMRDGTAGGHTDVHPDLGTIDHVRAVIAACRDRGMELALDVAFQCSPDHPWVQEHPEWFAHRADGTIQYAENPPKKYQDIYPLDFESSDWQGLWEALADVFRFWIAEGVRIFRIDNPHTKAFPFWEWCLTTLRAEHPDTIFLAEAFTRPRVMERLAKVGFNQSYTYFAWRYSAWELREYFEDLSTRTVDYFRPNAWPNTPDILTEQLQFGGRPVFLLRAVLAATLSANWGIYGPAFELLERMPVRPGSEEYLDSEKYQLREWDLDDPASLAPLIRRLNEIRRDQPAFRHLSTLRFHDTDAEGLLCFTKTDPNGVGGPVLVVVNVDERLRHAGMIHVDPATFGLGLGDDDEFEVVDLLGGGSYRWRGWHNYVDLSPERGAAHVFSVRRPAPEGPETGESVGDGTDGLAAR